MEALQEFVLRWDVKAAAAAVMLVLWYLIPKAGEGRGTIALVLLFTLALVVFGAGLLPCQFPLV